MTDDRKAESSSASIASSFAFIWQAEPSRTAGRNIETLLVWPLAEQRPRGAFGRFLVLEDRQGGAAIVVPMDLEATGKPRAVSPAAEPNTMATPPPQEGAARSVQEDLGSLPLLLRLPFTQPFFTVTVKYLVRRQIDGFARVEVVATPPFEFEELQPTEANHLMLVGFIRGEGTAGPARPVVMTGLSPLVNEANPPARQVSTHVDLVDKVFWAYETSSDGAEHKISVGIVLAIPRLGREGFGRAATILPHSGAGDGAETNSPDARARIRASTKILSREPLGLEDPPSLHPCFSLSIGASRHNQDELEPGIIFFRWDRTNGFLQSKPVPMNGQAGSSPALTLYRGRVIGAELTFAFDKVGFGDIVGVMVGPATQIVPSFSDWPDNDGLLFPGTPNDWTVAKFLWTGDELIPFTYYEQAEPGIPEVIAAVERELSDAAHRLSPPRRPNHQSDLRRYLLPQSRSAGSELSRLISAAIDENPANTIVALDPYCELLRELDRQIKQDGDPQQWRRLAPLFSFSAFEQAPHLLRALVALRDLRNGAITGLKHGGASRSDINLLGVMVNAIGIHSSDEQRRSRWLDSLAQTDTIAAWELIKREPDLLGKLIAMGVTPDLALLTDYFDGLAARSLEAYQAFALPDLSDAAQTQFSLGDRGQAALLRQAFNHRRGDAELIAYDRVAAVVEQMNRFLSSRPRE